MSPDRAATAKSGLSLSLYRKLYLIRRAEKAIIAHYAENDMKTPMHMSMGQEAAAVGVCEALGDKGQIFASYRSHAAYLARTGDAEAFFIEMYGRGGTATAGKAGSMHLASPRHGHVVSSAVVGSTIPLAAGAAFANRYLKNDRVACAFFGDGALEEGVFWETLNASALFKLPLLLVCEDNDLAQHAPKKARQAFRSIADVARQFPVEVIEEEAADAEKVHQAAVRALEAVRSGRPAFLLLKCYRYLEHVGVNEDFDAGYRSRADFETWLKKDPVDLQRKKLLASGFAEEDVCREERAIDEKIQKAVDMAKKAPFPEKSELLRGVFYENA